MTQDPSEYIRENEDRLALLLLAHTHFIASKYGWSSNSAWPKGTDAQWVVFEVLGRFASGRRKFNPNYPVEIQLKNAVKSIISSLYHNKDSETLSLDQIREAGGIVETVDQTPSPSEEFGSNHDAQVLFQWVWDHSVVQKSEELQLILLAILEGADTPEELAKATEIDIKRVYQLREKLKACYPAIRTKYVKEGQLHE